MLFAAGDQRGVGLGIIFAELIDKELLDEAVLIAEENHAARGLAVAASAAGLLVIGFERAGHVVMDDEADVGLVDAHAESVGGDGDGAGGLHELFLVGGAGCGVHATVISSDRAAGDVAAEKAVDFFDAFAGRAVDDRAAGLVAKEIYQKAVFVGRLG